MHWQLGHHEAALIVAGHLGVSRSDEPPVLSVRDGNLWVVAPQFLHRCMRGQSFRLPVCPVSPHSSQIAVRSQFAFDGSRFRCGASARACLGNWCACVLCRGRAHRKGECVVLICERLQRFCGSYFRSRCIVAFEGSRFGCEPWLFGSSVPWQLVHCVQTLDAQSAFVGCAAALAACSTFGC